MVDEEKKKIVRGKVEFFRLNSSKVEDKAKLKNKLNEIYNYFEEKKYENIPNLKINDEVFYIDAMQKRLLDHRLGEEYLYYWLVTLSKVNFDQKIVLADIQKKINERRRDVDHSENEGIVVDSRFVFDPFRNILAVYNKRGTVNRYELKKFISELLGVRGLTFEIILNENGYSRLGRLNIFDKVIYQIASPDNFNSYKDDGRSEFSDLKYARSINGNKLKVEVESSHLTKKNIFKKAKILFSSEDIDVTSFRVDGFSDGKKETIDLVNNKLVYSGNMFIKDYVDNQAAYGLLNEAYDKNYEYLKKMYTIIQ